LGAGPQEGTVTAWEPPHRFAQETTWDPGGDLPAARVATEWLVEARDDGTCLVRMVMRGFGTGAGWDDELEGMAAGMRAALHALASYRTHFPGRPAAWVRVSGAGTGAAAAAWDELTGALGLAGVVERAGDDAYGRSLLLRLERPGPGLAELYLLGSGGSLGFQARLYGDDRDEVAVRQQPAWAAWLGARFPAGG
jgi:hypothetical protein